MSFPFQKRLAITVFLICLHISSSEASITLTPGLVFSDQVFKVNLIIERPCNKGLKNISHEIIGDIIYFHAELEGDLTICLDASPPIPGVAIYHSEYIAGLPRGSYQISLSYTYLEAGELITADAEIFDFYVRSIDDFAGAGALHYNHESPSAGGTVSGVGLVRGWACYDSPLILSLVEYQIDDGARVVVPHGSHRPDTASRCNGDELNGYGAVEYWGNYSLGQHDLKLFINGKLTEETSFVVTGTGSEYLKGISGEFTLENFPENGMETDVRWSEALQNFIIIEVR